MSLWVSLRQRPEQRMDNYVTSRKSSVALDSLKAKDETSPPFFANNVPRTQLLRFEELPEWYQDNPYLQRSYRAVSNSILSCIESWSFVHNETVNIYSHLIPAIGFVVVQGFVQMQITKQFPGATIADRAVFALSLLAATAALTMSTVYHTLMNHSFHVSQLCLHVDYVGILTLILGSFFSGIYVGFYCEPHLQKIHWSMIATLSVITSVLVLHPKLQGLKYRAYRTTAFIATGLSGFAPITHGLFIYGWNEMWVQSGMPYWFLEGAIYGLGAFFFTTRIPECLWPGQYDLWGSSHQIFHILVVLGSVVHFAGVWDAFKWHYTSGNVCLIK